MSRGELEGCLRWSAFPFADVEWGMCSTLLLPLTLRKWKLGFLGLFVSFVRTLPQLHMHSFSFSPL